MLEPPAIPIEYITSCLQAEFGLSLKEITFLPLGYDVNTAVYRAITMDNDYFVKLRRGEFNAVTVELPYFLCSQGVPGIVPPIKSTSDRLFGMCGEYTLILYPYIAGQDGYQVQLEPAHWSQLGDTLRRVHSIQLPAGLVSLIPKETYNPAWRADTRHFLDLASRITYTDPVAQKVIRLLITRRPLILHMVERAEILAHSLDDARADRVLCHSDAHLGNFLVSDTETVYLVDWDNPIFAPRERDLMFFGTGMFAKDQVEPEKTWFYNGYGPVEINPIALAYFLYERVIDDIAEFCNQLLLSDLGGEDREQAYTFLTSTFNPGGWADVALRHDAGNLRAMDAPE